MLHLRTLLDLFIELDQNAMDSILEGKTGKLLLMQTLLLEMPLRSKSNNDSSSWSIQWKNIRKEKNKS